MKITLNALRICILILIFLLALNEATEIYLDDIVEEEMLEASTLSSIPLNGYFEGVEENNYIVTGAYKNGILDGDITISDNQDNLIFTGYVQDGIYAGFGQIYYYGNIIYEGRFKNGLYNGYGIEYNYDNDGNLNWIYKGQFKKGHKNGYGIIEIDNVIYSGKFQNDVFEGRYYASNSPLVPNIPSLMMEPNYNEKYKKVQENDDSILDKAIKIVSNRTENTKNNQNNPNKDTKIAINGTNSLQNVQYDTKITRSHFLNIIKNSDYGEKSNIYAGNDQGDLMLNINITYQEVLEILYRILEENEKIQDISLNNLRSITASTWAQKAIIYLHSIGLIDYDTDFDYEQDISGKELYKILNNFENYY